MHQDGNPSTSLTNTQVGNFVSGLRLTITLCLAITLKIIWDLMNTSFVFNICCRWHHSCCFNIPMLPFDCTWLIIVPWMLERVLIMMHILLLTVMRDIQWRNAIYMMRHMRSRSLTGLLLPCEILLVFIFTCMLLLFLVTKF